MWNEGNHITNYSERYMLLLVFQFNLYCVGYAAQVGETKYTHIFLRKPCRKFVLGTIKQQWNLTRKSILRKLDLTV